jgi:hypothetical protein
MVISSSTGDALAITSGAGDGHGIVVQGDGGGEGIRATGGPDGNGIQAIGGSTVGNGLRIDGIGIAAGVGITGGNTGSGIEIAAGSGGNGSGITFAGRGTGDGLRSTGGANGDGLDAIGQGTGVDIRGDITGTIDTVTEVTNDVGITSGAVDDILDEALGTVTASTVPPANPTLRQFGIYMWMNQLFGRQVFDRTTGIMITENAAGADAFQQDWDDVTGDTIRGEVTDMP